MASTLVYFVFLSFTFGVLALEPSSYSWTFANISEVISPVTGNLATAPYTPIHFRFVPSYLADLVIQLNATSNDGLAGGILTFRHYDCNDSIANCTTQVQLPANLSQQQITVPGVLDCFFGCWLAEWPQNIKPQSPNMLFYTPPGDSVTFTISNLNATDYPATIRTNRSQVICMYSFNASEVILPGLFSSHQIRIGDIIYARMAIIGSEMNLCWNTETFLTLAAPISLSVCVTSFQDMWPNVTDPLTNCYTFSNSSLPSSSAVEVSTNANSTAVVLQQGAWAGIQTFSSNVCAGSTARVTGAFSFNATYVAYLRRSIEPADKVVYFPTQQCSCVSTVNGAWSSYCARLDCILPNGIRRMSLFRFDDKVWVSYMKESLGSVVTRDFMPPKEKTTKEISARCSPTSSWLILAAIIGGPLLVIGVVLAIILIRKQNGDKSEHETLLH